MNIIELIEKDKKFRYQGIKEDLFTLEDIESDKTLDFNFPVLCARDFNEFNILSNSAEKFKINLYKKYPFLQKINMNNLLIAGGSLCNVIKKLNSRDSDIDFFIYGLDSNEADKKI